MEFKINKDNWERVTLGDVVYEPKETAKDIIAEGFEHIVGLEHIESGDVHLRNSFSIDTDTTFTKVFRAGDVLFGRRRAYLKKAAQAVFDGVCSGDITVMRANDKLDVRLLPFVIHNDKFFDYAVKHSAGGLSPRVKFKDLANYEFLLPPKAQQAELAELLWAMDTVIEKDLEVLERLVLLKESTISTYISTIKKHKSLEQIIDEVKGICFDGDWIESKDQSQNGIRLIQLADIGRGTFLNKSDKFISEETFVKLKCKGVFKDDLIIARMPEPIGRSCIIPELNTKAITAVDCCILRIDDSEIREYLNSIFNTNFFENLCNQNASGTTRIRISRKNLLKLSIPFDQSTISTLNEDLASIKANVGQLASKLQSSKTLQKALINQVF